MIKGLKITPVMAGQFAIFIVTILIIAKAYAYSMSGAVSVLSSLTDSILDAAVSIMALSSMYYARRPADEDHRWGHGKMEAISALFQSAIIIGGAAFLCFESSMRLFYPTEIKHIGIGINVMILSVILSVILVTVQRISIKQSGSLAVEADSVHYGSDVLVNIGTIFVLLFANMNAPQWIDPLFSIGVALFMVYTAREISVKSFNMLLDREISEEKRAQVIEIIEGHDGVLGWHDLRTRMNGSTPSISFDIEADPDLSLWAAHAITKDLEEGILKLFDDADIIVHVDPEGFIEDARHRVKGVHH